MLLQTKQDQGTDPVGHSLIKAADIKTGLIFDLLQTIKKRIAVYVELLGSLRNIHIVAEKTVGCILVFRIEGR